MRLLHVGFTGTRRGLTEKQRVELQKLLAREDLVGGVFHHGDCVGADAEADAIAYDLRYWITVHPAAGSNLRAGCYHESAFEVLEAHPPLKRNRDIVDASELIIACPRQNREVLRSGTWATVRYATKIGKPVFMILP